MQEESIVNKVLALHGLPFTDPEGPLPATCGEPVRLPSLSEYDQGHLTKLLSRTFTITEEFVNVTAARSASWEDRDAADKRRDAGLAEVWREVRAEGPSAIAMSGHLLVHRVLDEMRGGVGQLPSYAEWLASGAPRQALGKMSDSFGVSA